MDQTVEAAAQQTSRRLPTWAMVLAFTLLVAFLGLVYFGLRNSMAGPLSIGQPAPKFTLQTFDGQVVDVRDLEGKIILVNFWASWCKPCEDEAAALEEAWRRYQADGDVVFLGVDYVDTESEARAYLEKFNITYPNGPDLKSSISDLYNISGVPETYIIGPDGTLKYAKKGPFLSINEIIMVVDGLRQGNTGAGS
ncbi:MAG TPA: redoxin domain-containing protein [Chloroflexi bacterium]|jgi:cytochrome c biogenesis protein CcmG/thiol:disulfide interchange protein DsbE|nr:redoxin domain-containing protein [Chloroflexota bacterium]